MTAQLRPGRRVFTLICEVCQTSFESNHADQRFCGKSCAMRRHWETHVHHAPDQSKANSPEARAKKSAALSGSGNPMHGRTGSANPAFTTGQYAGVKRYRRANAGVCADCGTTSQPNGRRLSVHHEDRDRTNNDPANLTTLCQGCHLKRHLAAGEIRRAV